MDLMKRTVEIVLLENKEEYRAEYEKVFVKGNFKLFSVPVIFSTEDFDHIFSEPTKDLSKRSFSLRRAKKMMYMKALIEQIAKIELTFEKDTKNIAIFSIELDCVMYLRIRPKTKSLQIRTFFDFGKAHNKMYKKQRSKCVDMTKEALVEAVSSGPTTS